MALAPDRPSGIGVPVIVEPPHTGFSVGPLHPPLGLRRVGMDDLDLQARQGTSERGLGVAVGRVFPVDPEDAVGEGRNTSAGDEAC